MRIGRTGIDEAVLCGALALCLTSASAMGEDGGSISAQAAQPARAHRNGSPLEGRIRLLAKELNLDERQQDEVKRILVVQREQVRQVWNDETMPAPLRVQATQKISEHTSDQIRALLNEEQRKRYSKPVPREYQANRGDPESWMQNGGGAQTTAGPMTQP